MTANIPNSLKPIPLWLNWPITFNGPDLHDWQTTLFTWSWRSLLPRVLKLQSPTTVLLRTTLTWMITLNKLWILLGSNLLPYINLSQSVFCIQSFEAPIEYPKYMQYMQSLLALPSPFSCYVKSLLAGYSASSVNAPHVPRFPHWA